jgi:hypothetical protein
LIGVRLEGVDVLFAQTSDDGWDAGVGHGDLLGGELILHVAVGEPGAPEGNTGEEGEDEDEDGLEGEDSPTKFRCHDVLLENDLW